MHSISSNILIRILESYESFQSGQKGIEIIMSSLTWRKGAKLKEKSGHGHIIQRTDNRWTV